MTPPDNFAANADELLSPDRLREMSGLEFIRGMVERDLPYPPICKALNYWPVEASDGRVVFRGEPTFEHYNPLGAVHGGWFGTLLDSCMACAVQTRLPKGRTYTTLEFKINVLRPIVADSGTYLAAGECEHAGRRTGVATGKIVGETDGKLYATGSTTCLVLDFPNSG